MKPMMRCDGSGIGNARDAQRFCILPVLDHSSFAGVQKHSQRPHWLFRCMYLPFRGGRRCSPHHHRAGTQWCSASLQQVWSATSVSLLTSCEACCMVCCMCADRCAVRTVSLHARYDTSHCTNACPNMCPVTGADVNISNSGGRAAAHYAVSAGQSCSRHSTWSSASLDCVVEIAG